MLFISRVFSASGRSRRAIVLPAVPMTVDSVNAPARRPGRGAAVVAQELGGHHGRRPGWSTHRTTVRSACGQRVLLEPAEELRPDLVAGGEQEQVEEDDLDERVDLDVELPDEHAGEQRADDVAQAEAADADAPDDEPDGEGQEDRELGILAQGGDEPAHGRVPREPGRGRPPSAAAARPVPAGSGRWPRPGCATASCGRVEAVGVLRLHEVQVELAAALRRPAPPRARRPARPPAFAALMSAIRSMSASMARLRSVDGALLDRLGARQQLLLGPLVAGLAGVVDVEQRAAHVVVADLQRAHARVRHVAVGAGHARARVDALVPHLELGVLRLELLASPSPRGPSP